MHGASYRENVFIHSNEPNTDTITASPKQATARQKTPTSCLLYNVRGEEPGSIRSSEAMVTAAFFLGRAKTVNTPLERTKKQRQRHFHSHDREGIIAWTAVTYRENSLPSTPINTTNERAQTERRGRPINSKNKIDADAIVYTCTTSSRQAPQMSEQSDEH